MKLVVQVKLLPTPEQTVALEATLHAVNTAAALVSAVAFDQRCFRNYDLREHTYDRIKAECGLAAQAAQHVIKSSPMPTAPSTPTSGPATWARRGPSAGPGPKAGRSPSGRTRPSPTTIGACPG
ncbi:hypothetical protein ACIBI7_26370 [Nonomuraea fuscirosea]|uniref:hypothetical protein n=1 Tax=Nonomuraea fuscirosea TaxID=1291556 RepID=UPI003788B850